MKKLLVATDFSAAALNAAEYAADMALATNAELMLLHVYQVPVSYTELPVTTIDVDFLERAQKSMKELRDQLYNRMEAKVMMDTELRMGYFFEELNKVCEMIDPYAVIMGTQGKTAAENLFFGGHAVHAMKHLTWPLITVPPGAKFAGINKIGLACDFANVVDTMPAEEIKKLVSDFKAELHVLNTGKSSEYNPEEVQQAGLLQEMLDNIKPVYDFLSSDDTDQAIIDFAAKNHIDLLIVVPKRHGLMDRFLHKSHTKQFVLHSTVPVMALHE
jgi:nucleotide-binding universal stress UspA family protein